MCIGCADSVPKFKIGVQGVKIAVQGTIYVCARYCPSYSKNLLL
jgi:hypothetical protein